MEGAKFQTNDKPWSEVVLPQDYTREFARRLRSFLGPFHIREQGGQYGPYRKREEAVHRAVTRLTAGEQGFQLWVANASNKGVRARVIDVENPWGPIYHTTGPCRDDYPNIKVWHNRAGQLVKMQEPALEAYAEAERLNGKAILITGMAWRSCSQQWDLYNSDPGRFANPNTSRHCRGLAMDVAYTSTNLTSKARDALVAVGFNFAVAGEPWHASFIESA